MKSAFVFPIRFANTGGETMTLSLKGLAIAGPSGWRASITIHNNVEVAGIRSLNLGPKWDRTPPRYTDTTALYGQYGHGLKLGQRSQMPPFQGVPRNDRVSLGS